MRKGWFNNIFLEHCVKVVLHFMAVQSGTQILRVLTLLKHLEGKESKIRYPLKCGYATHILFVLKFLF